MTNDTHSKNIQALREAFEEKKIQALTTNKIRGVATVREVCKAAGVDHTYLYKKSVEFKAYIEIREKIIAFADDFKRIKAGAQEVDDELKQKYHNSMKSNLFLSKENAELRYKIGDRTETIQRLESENAALQAVNTNTRMSSATHQMNQNKVHIISPDKTLQYNSHYHFYDEKLRKKAWEVEKRKFKELMRKPLPMRVYLLIGLPCSGKTTWTESSKNILPDRHSIIVDATNLTAGDRAMWLSMARPAKNIKTCAVRFMTNFTTICERNALRMVTEKYIEKDVLEQKLDSLEEVDVEFEDFDEMLIVREE